MAIERTTKADDLIGRLAFFRLMGVDSHHTVVEIRREIVKRSGDAVSKLPCAGKWINISSDQSSTIGDFEFVVMPVTETVDSILRRIYESGQIWCDDRGRPDYDFWYSSNSGKEEFFVADRAELTLCSAFEQFVYLCRK